MKGREKHHFPPPDCRRQNPLPGRFPFYFLFKKRQVEMTTSQSRVFRPPPGMTICGGRTPVDSRYFNGNRSESGLSGLPDHRLAEAAEPVLEVGQVAPYRQDDAADALL